MRSIRSRFIPLWLLEDELSVAPAISFDVHRFPGSVAASALNQTLWGDEFVPSVLETLSIPKGIRLIRSLGLPFFRRGMTRSICSIAEQTQQPWLTFRCDCSPPRLYPWLQSENVFIRLPAIEKVLIRSCVINIAIDEEHNRFGETRFKLGMDSLGGVIDPSRRPKYWVVITRYTYKHGHNKDQYHPIPPAKPSIFLNTLIDSLIRLSAEVVLVGCEGWEEEWLGQKYRIDDTILEEPTDQPFSKRLEWWVLVTASRRYDTPGAIEAALDKIKFASWAEFKGSVPTREMFDLMVDPEWW